MANQLATTQAPSVTVGPTANPNRLAVGGQSGPMAFALPPNATTAQAAAEKIQAAAGILSNCVRRQQGWLNGWHNGWRNG